MIYRAHIVLPIVSEPIEGGEVLVRDGHIAAVGTDLTSAAPREPVEDLGHAALMPGLVNVHCHLDYTIMRGLLDDEPFFPWIRQLTEYAKKLTYDDFLASARFGLLQLVRSGVTAIGDSSLSGAAAEAACQAGLRGIVYQETFGADPSKDYQQQIDELSEQISKLRQKTNDCITIGVSPHSVYTSSERLLRMVADLARDEGLPVALHAAETKDEVVLIESAEGHIADLYRLLQFDFTARGKSPVAYLHDIGLLNQKTIAAHCVHVTDSDLDIIAETEACIAHCPISNAKLGVGTAPLHGFLQRGILTGLGTDSAASDSALDMFEEMRFAVYAQRMRENNVHAMDARRILELATLGGATALGLETEIGSIEQGKKADLIAVDLSSPAAFTAADPYSAVVYSCSAGDVMMNVIGGETVYRSRQYTRVDAAEIRRSAALSASKL